MNTCTHKIYTFRLCVYTNSDIYSACKLLWGIIYRWKAEEMCKRARNHFPFMQIWWSRLLAPREDVGYYVINIQRRKRFRLNFFLSCEYQFLSFLAKGFCRFCCCCKSQVERETITSLGSREEEDEDWTNIYRFIPISIFGACRLQEIYIRDAWGPRRESWICIM